MYPTNDGEAEESSFYTYINDSFIVHKVDSFILQLVSFLSDGQIFVIVKKVTINFPKTKILHQIFTICFQLSTEQSFDLNEFLFDSNVVRDYYTIVLT